MNWFRGRQCSGGGSSRFRWIVGDAGVAGVVASIPLEEVHCSKSTSLAEECCTKHVCAFVWALCVCYGG